MSDDKDFAVLGFSIDSKAAEDQIDAFIAKINGIPAKIKGTGESIGEELAKLKYDEQVKQLKAKINTVQGATKEVASTVERYYADLANKTVAHFAKIQTEFVKAFALPADAIAGSGTAVKSLGGELDGLAGKYNEVRKFKERFDQSVKDFSKPFAKTEDFDSAIFKLGELKDDVKKFVRHIADQNDQLKAVKIFQPITDAYNAINERTKKTPPSKGASFADLFGLDPQQIAENTNVAGSALDGFATQLSTLSTAIHGIRKNDITNINGLWTALEASKNVKASKAAQASIASATSVLDGVKQLVAAADDRDLQSSTKTFAETFSNTITSQFTESFKLALNNLGGSIQETLGNLKLPEKNLYIKLLFSNGDESQAVSGSAAAGKVTESLLKAARQQGGDAEILAAKYSDATEQLKNLNEQYKALERNLGAIGRMLGDDTRDLSTLGKEFEQVRTLVEAAYDTGAAWRKGDQKNTDAVKKRLQDAFQTAVDMTAGEMGKQQLAIEDASKKLLATMAPSLEATLERLRNQIVTQLQDQANATPLVLSPDSMTLAPRSVLIDISNTKVDMTKNEGGTETPPIAIPAPDTSLVAEKLAELQEMYDAVAAYVLTTPWHVPAPTFDSAAFQATLDDVKAKITSLNSLHAQMGIDVTKTAVEQAMSKAKRLLAELAQPTVKLNVTATQAAVNAAMDTIRKALAPVANLTIRISADVSKVASAISGLQGAAFARFQTWLDNHPFRLARLDTSKPEGSLQHLRDSELMGLQAWIDAHPLKLPAVDTSEFKSALSALKQIITDINKSISKGTNLCAKLTQNMRQLNQQQQHQSKSRAVQISPNGHGALETNITANIAGYVKKVTNAVAEAFADVTKNMPNNQRKMVRDMLRSVSAFKEYTKVLNISPDKGPLDAKTARWGDLSDMLERAQRNITENGAKVNKILESSGKVTGKVEQTLAKYGDRANGIKDIGNAKEFTPIAGWDVVKIDTNIARNTNSLKMLELQSAKTKNVMLDSFRAIGIAVSGRSIAKFFKESMQSANAFGMELRRIQSLATEFSFERLDTALKSIDARFGNLVHNARALYWAYSSGIRGTEKELADFTEIMAKTALTIRADVMPTMDAATSIMNAYGLKAKDAAEVSDLLFTIVKEGKASGMQLAQSFGHIVATASAMGLTLNDVGASVSTLTRTMKTQNALTYLNNILMKMQNPTGEVAEVLGRLGLEINSTAIKAKGFAQVMREIHEATKGDINLISKIFPDIRGQRAAITLLSTQYGDFEKQLANFNNKAGNMEEALEKITDTPDAAWRAMGTSLEIVKTEAGEAAINVATLGGSITGVLEKFNKLGSFGRSVLGNAAAFAMMAAGAVAIQNMMAMVGYMNAKARYERSQAELAPDMAAAEDALAARKAQEIDEKEKAARADNLAEEIKQGSVTLRNIEMRERELEIRKKIVKAAKEEVRAAAEQAGLSQQIFKDTEEAGVIQQKFALWDAQFQAAASKFLDARNNNGLAGETILQNLRIMIQENNAGMIAAAERYGIENAQDMLEVIRAAINEQTVSELMGGDTNIEKVVQKVYADHFQTAAGGDFASQDKMFKKFLYDAVGAVASDRYFGVKQAELAGGGKIDKSAFQADVKNLWAQVIRPQVGEMKALMDAALNEIRKTGNEALAKQLEDVFKMQAAENEKEIQLAQERFDAEYDTSNATGLSIAQLKESSKAHKAQAKELATSNEALEQNLKNIKKNADSLLDAASVSDKTGAANDRIVAKSREELEKFNSTVAATGKTASGATIPMTRGARWSGLMNSVSGRENLLFNGNIASKLRMLPMPGVGMLSSMMQPLATFNKEINKTLAGATASVMRLEKTVAWFFTKVTGMTKANKWLQNVDVMKLAGAQFNKQITGFSSAIAALGSTAGATALAIVAAVGGLVWAMESYNDDLSGITGSIAKWFYSFDKITKKDDFLEGMREYANTMSERRRQLRTQLAGEERALQTEREFYATLDEERTALVDERIESIREAQRLLKGGQRKSALVGARGNLQNFLERTGYSTEWQNKTWLNAFLSPLFELSPSQLFSTSRFRRLLWLDKIKGNAKKYQELTGKYVEAMVDNASINPEVIRTAVATSIARKLNETYEEVFADSFTLTESIANTEKKIGNTQASLKKILGNKRPEEYVANLKVTANQLEQDMARRQAEYNLLLAQGYKADGDKAETAKKILDEATKRFNEAQRKADEAQTSIESYYSQLYRNLKQQQDLQEKLRQLTHDMENAGREYAGMFKGGEDMGLEIAEANWKKAIEEQQTLRKKYKESQLKQLRERKEAGELTTEDYNKQKLAIQRLDKIPEEMALKAQQAVNQTSKALGDAYVKQLPTQVAQFVSSEMQKITEADWDNALKQNPQRFRERLQASRANLDRLVAGMTPMLSELGKENTLGGKAGVLSRMQEQYQQISQNVDQVLKLEDELDEKRREANKGLYDMARALTKVQSAAQGAVDATSTEAISLMYRTSNTPIVAPVTPAQPSSRQELRDMETTYLTIMRDAYNEMRNRIDTRMREVEDAAGISNDRRFANMSEFNTSVNTFKTAVDSMASSFDEWRRNGLSITYRDAFAQ